MAQVAAYQKKPGLGEQILGGLSAIGGILAAPVSLVAPPVGVALGAAAGAAGLGAQAAKEQPKGHIQVSDQGGDAMARRLGQDSEDHLTTLRNGVLALPSLDVAQRKEVGPPLIQAYTIALGQNRDEQLKAQRMV